MASSLLIKKSISAMLTAVILVISMAVSVSADGGTAFSYTLEEETVIADYEIPKGSLPESQERIKAAHCCCSSAWPLCLAFLSGMGSAGIVGMILSRQKQRSK